MIVSIAIKQMYAAFRLCFQEKNVISDPEPYLQEFYLKNTEDTLAHDGCVNDPCVILSKYSYQFKQ